VTKIIYSNFSWNEERLSNRLSSPVLIFLLVSSKLYVLQFTVRNLLCFTHKHLQVASQFHNCNSLICNAAHSHRATFAQHRDLYASPTHHVAHGLKPNTITHTLFFSFILFLFFFFYFVCGSHLRKDPPNKI
jgi:preprotein translocase subunit SecY